MLVATVVIDPCVAVLTSYMAVWQGSGSSSASSMSVFTSRSAGQPVPYPIPRHPIITFGDSITEGYGATNKRLPRELRAILPESAQRVYTGDISYHGDLARLGHRRVLNDGVVAN
jgi:hypothetical protein